MFDGPSPAPGFKEFLVLCLLCVCLSLEMSLSLFAVSKLVTTLAVPAFSLELVEMHECSMSLIHTMRYMF